MELSASGDDGSVTRSAISGAKVTVGGQTADTRTQELTGSDGKTVAKATTEQDTTGALKNNFDLNEIQTGFQITQAFVQQVGTFLDNRAKEADAKATQAKEAEQKADDPNNGLNDDLTEQLVNSVAERQGLKVLSGGKYGSNNGFDHVLQGPDGTVTILLDSKQIVKGGAKLSVGAGDNIQLTDYWINTVLSNRRLPGFQ